ncbi:hypothetical protein AC84_5900, partial [Escherichia coli 1-392-07_S4_C1]
MPVFTAGQYSLCITGPYTCRMQLHQQRRMLIYTSE